MGRRQRCRRRVRETEQRREQRRKEHRDRVDVRESAEMTERKSAHTHTTQPLHCIVAEERGLAADSR